MADIGFNLYFKAIACYLAILICCIIVFTAIIVGPLVLIISSIYCLSTTNSECPHHKTSLIELSFGVAMLAATLISYPVIYTVFKAATTKDITVEY